MKIVINLAPCDIKKSGSHFDLGMAVGLLLQSKQVFVDEIERFGFIGELSLDACLRPCTGVLPMVIEAKRKGINNLILAKANMREASLVSGVNLFGFDTLSEVIEFIEGTNEYTETEDYKKEHIIQTKNLLDFKEVQGQDAPRKYYVELQL
ncbi:magnesium chelatase domain-containing protein [Clostridium sediminicola]|uniref:magnesium chelatase domain-containing protein n=1 Tax=Clostridium sediminicola TaxID=3114879 RepID=UPI003D17C4E2